MDFAKEQEGHVRWAFNVATWLASDEEWRSLLVFTQVCFVSPTTTKMGDLSDLSLKRNRRSIVTSETWIRKDVSLGDLC